MCDICGKTNDNSTEYGQILEHNGVTVHYYCILLSTNLCQNGKDASGILGFLLKDVRKEIENAKKRICYYCHDKGASIKCNTCDKYFHHICGLEKNCLFQFIDTFSSYCHKHHNIKHKKPHGLNAECAICMEKMGEYNPLKSIAPKCCDFGWIHRHCLKSYALSAGYYLICCFCGEKQFRDDIRRMGIFVPDRDASWEKIRNNYQDIYRRHVTCQADKCLCPKGRKYNQNTKWKIKICSVCGGNGIHADCQLGELEKKVPFVCNVCNTSMRIRSIPRDYNGLGLDLTMFMSKSQRILFDDITAESFQSSSFYNVTETYNDINEISNQTAGNQFQQQNIPEGNQEVDNDDEDVDQSRRFFYIMDEKQNVVGLLEGKLKNPNNINEEKLSFDDVEYTEEDVLIESETPNFEEEALEAIDQLIIDFAHECYPELEQGGENQKNSKSSTDSEGGAGGGRGEGENLKNTKIDQPSNSGIQKKNKQESDNEFLLNLFFDRYDYRKRGHDYNYKVN